MNDTRRVRFLIAAIVAGAVGVAAYASLYSHLLHPTFAFAILVLASAMSRMKVKLPGLDGNMSVNLPFLLAAIGNLSAAEAMVIALISTTVQCWPRKRAAFRLDQLIFNLGMMVLATTSASLVCHAHWTEKLSPSNPMPIILATVTLLFGQTLPVSGVISLSQSKTMFPVWKHVVHLSFPYYILSAGIAFMAQAAIIHMGWQLTLAVIPVMYGIHCSYRLYFASIAESVCGEIRVRAAGAGA